MMQLHEQYRAAVPQYFPRLLRDELDLWHDMYLESDEPQHSPAALFYLAVEEMMDREDVPRGWTTAVRTYWIALGVYRVVSPDEMASAVVLGVPKYDFKRGGKFYIFHEHPKGGIR